MKAMRVIPQFLKKPRQYAEHYRFGLWLSWPPALALAVGVVLAPVLPPAPLPSAVALGLSLLLGGVYGRYRRGRWRWGLYLSLVVFGWSYGADHLQRLLAMQWPQEHSGQSRVIEAVVSQLPQQRLGQYQVALRPLATAEGEQLWLRWPQEQAPPKVGERLKLQVRLQTPRGWANPGGYQRERWLLAQGFTATGKVERVLERQPSQRWSFDLWREQLRARIAEALAGHPQQALVQALVIGDQAALPAEAWQGFQRTGTAHLISISGSHVSLFFMLISTVLGFGLRRWGALHGRGDARRWAWLLGWLASAAYVGVAGAGVPALRTLLMLAVVLLSQWFSSRPSKLQAWTLALAAVLLLQPLAAWSAGFWLSFVAVGVLLWTTGLIDGQWPQWRQLLSSQLVMSLLMWPLGLVFFGSVSLVSPLANALAIPLLGAVLVPAAVLASLLDATGALRLVAEALALLDRYWIAPLAHVPLLYQAQITSVVAATAVLALLLAWSFKAWPWRLLAALGLLGLVWPHRPLPALEAWVWDVGQGLSVLVRSPELSLLYDTGARWEQGTAADIAVIPSLHAVGVHRLDVLVLSHQDNDHIGGAEAVLKALPVGAVLSHVQQVQPERWGVPRWPCRAPWQRQFGAVELKLLHPAHAISGSSDNDSSCTLKITHPYGSLLLVGDAGHEVEREWLAQQLPLAASVLVAGHHGSKHSTSEALLQAVQPQWVLYSAGWKNRYGHPDAEVTERVAKLGIAQRNTAEAGAIHVVWDHNGVHVRGWREMSGEGRQ